MALVEQMAEAIYLNFAKMAGRDDFTPYAEIGNAEHPENEAHKTCESIAQAALDAINAAGMVVVKRDDVKRIAHKIRLEAERGSMLFSHRQIMYDWEHLVGRMPNSPDLPGDAVEQKFRAENPEGSR